MYRRSVWLGQVRLGSDEGAKREQGPVGGKLGTGGQFGEVRSGWDRMRVPSGSRVQSCACMCSTNEKSLFHQ